MNFNKAFKISVIIGLMLVMVVGVIGAIGQQQTQQKTTTQKEMGGTAGAPCTKTDDCKAIDGICFSGKCATKTAQTGVAHKASEIFGIESAKIGESTLGGLLGLLKGDAVTSALKKMFNVGFGYSSPIRTDFKNPKYGEVLTAIMKDKEIDKKFQKESYVEQAAFSGVSYFADTSAFAQSAEKAEQAKSASVAGEAQFAGGCTLMGVRDYTGQSSVLLYGSDSCPALPKGLQRFELLINSGKKSDVLYTKKGSDAKKVTYTGLIYCCKENINLPKITYIGSLTEAGKNIYIKTISATPIETCAFRFIRATDTSKKKTFTGLYPFIHENYESDKKSGAENKCQDNADPEEWEDCWAFNIGEQKVAEIISVGGGGQYWIEVECRYKGHTSGFIRSSSTTHIAVLVGR